MLTLPGKLEEAFSKWRFPFPRRPKIVLSFTKEKQTKNLTSIEPVSKTITQPNNNKIIVTILDPVSPSQQGNRKHMHFMTGCRTVGYSSWETAQGVKTLTGQRKALRLIPRTYMKLNAAACF